MCIQRRWSTPALWVFFVAAFSCPLLAQPTFRIMDATTFNGISGDGSVVVGCDFSFTWEKGTRLTGVGCAYSASMDGSVIVGVRNRNPKGHEAVRWVHGSIQGLGDLQDGIPTSSASGVSSDGSVVVGTGFGEAFRWENGTMTGLGNLPGGRESQATAVSGDGRIVVGYGFNASGNNEAFRWENGTMVGLRVLPVESGFSQATAISADGQVVVGLATGDHGAWRAFRWEDGIMTMLGPVPATSVSWALGVSGNGVIVVGRIDGAAFIWDQANGIRRLEDVLRDELGLNLGLWTLISANAVSADGLTIVGQAYNGGGYRGFVARLGYSETADADGDGVPDSLDACADTIAGVPVDSAGCPPKFPNDLDRDGDSDLADLALFLRCWSGPGIPIDPACLNGE